MLGELLALNLCQYCVSWWMPPILMEFFFFLLCDEFKKKKIQFKKKKRERETWIVVVLRNEKFLQDFHLTALQQQRHPDAVWQMHDGYWRGEWGDGHRWSKEWQAARLSARALHGRTDRWKQRAEEEEDKKRAENYFKNPQMLQKWDSQSNHEVRLQHRNGF